MSFGEQLRRRREELGMSRDTLAEMLGVSRSAIGNYETGVSSPKEDVLLRLFDALQVDPNYLYRGAFRHAFTCSGEEQRMVEKYRALPLAGRQMVHAVLDGLSDLQEQWRQDAPEDSRDFLKLFSFICELSFDVYVKKLLIEKLIDQLAQTPFPDQTRESKKESKNKEKK